MKSRTTSSPDFIRKNPREKEKKLADSHEMLRTRPSTCESEPARRLAPALSAGSGRSLQRAVLDGLEIAHGRGRHVDAVPVRRDAGRVAHGGLDRGGGRE